MDRPKKLFYIMSAVINLLTIALITMISMIGTKEKLPEMIISFVLVILLGMVANALNMTFYVKCKED